MNLDALVFLLRSGGDYAFTISYQALKFLSVRSGIILSTFLVHQAPMEHRMLIRRDYDSSSSFQMANGIVSSSSTTPPALSKLLAYNVAANILPKQTVPVPSKIMENLTSQQVQRLKNYYHASTIYEGLYFTPIETKFGKGANLILGSTGLEIIRGLFAPLRNMIGTAIGKGGHPFFLAEYAYFPNLAKYYLSRWQYMDSVRERSAKENTNIIDDSYEERKNLELLSNLIEIEGGNYTNNMTEFVVQMKNVISNLVATQATKLALEFMESTLPYGKSSNRRKMFRKSRPPLSPRKLYYKKKVQLSVIRYIKAIAGQEKKYQLLYKKYKDAPLSEKEERKDDIKKQINFPSLMIFSEYGDFWYNYIVKCVNYYVAPSYAVSFDCDSLEESLAVFADKPEAAQGNFLTYIFDIVRHDIQLKKIFLDTKYLEYRLDFLVFPNSRGLIKSRFDGGVISARSFLALNLFLEKLHRGPYATYIFTVNPKTMMYKVDPAIARRVDYVISVESNENTSQQDMEEFFFHLYSMLPLTAISSVDPNDFLSWIIYKVKKNSNLQTKVVPLIIEMQKFAIASRRLCNWTVIHILSERVGFSY